MKNLIKDPSNIIEKLCVSCDECSCLILKENANKVERTILPPLYYCDKCKKPYKKIIYDLPFYDGKKNESYWDLKEVDKDGKIIEK